MRMEAVMLQGSENMQHMVLWLNSLFSESYDFRRPKQRIVENDALKLN